MVKITNGTNVFEVSSGAFEDIYSKQGYHRLGEAKQEVAIVPEKTEDEMFLESVIEKPLSQWNKNEVKQFSELMSIDITGTKNIGEAKGLIKGFLDQSE